MNNELQKSKEAGHQIADSLFEQIANISKAHAYDIVSKQVGELKEILRQLIEYGELEGMEFTEPEQTKEFDRLIQKAKLLSL